jgi:cytochrome c-type biogenesis protein CcmH
MRRWPWVMVLAVLPALHGAWADSPAPDPKDAAGALVSDMSPAMADRFRHLTSQLRCLVCQNETIFDSPSDFAADMRREIKGMMINKKMSDKQITDYLVARYGDFILFNPPLQSNTVMLWFGPFILAVIGAATLLIYIRRRRRAPAESELTTTQRQQVQALLNDGGGENKA